jgi:transposase InsO family protein
MTYVWTWEGWLFLAAIVDVFSRRIVGWAVADHLLTELALEALGYGARNSSSRMRVWSITRTAAASTPASSIGWSSRRAASFAA